jgi:hypothetical protein
MHNRPRLDRRDTQSNDTPGQPGQSEEPGRDDGPLRRYLAETIYGIGGAAVFLIWLVTRLASEPVSATFATYVAQPYVVIGVALFGGRALVREQLRWCRSCHRYKALEWKGERVLRRRPFRQTRTIHTETFNPRGEKISTSRQRSTSRAVRETVAVERACRYCGAVRLFREMRDR